MSGYSFDEIQYWINSLEATTFSGEKVLIAYDASFEMVETLLESGCQVVTFSRDEGNGRYCFPVKGFQHRDSSINRFFQVWRFLTMVKNPYRFVICVDVRDLIFQSDPAEWLEKNMTKGIINVGSEGLRVRDEPWLSKVLKREYGSEIYEYLLDHPIYNAGTLGCQATAIEQLALNIYLCSRLNNISYSDQAALNLLLSIDPYQNITQFNASGESWACQADAVTNHKYLKSHNGKITTAKPRLDGELICSPDGTSYCIVHQYDRIPEWKDVLQQRFRDRT